MSSRMIRITTSVPAPMYISPSFPTRRSAEPPDEERRRDDEAHDEPDHGRDAPEQHEGRLACAASRDCLLGRVRRGRALVARRGGVVRGVQRAATLAACSRSWLVGYPAAAAAKQSGTRGSPAARVSPRPAVGKDRRSDALGRHAHPRHRRLRTGDAAAITLERASDGHEEVHVHPGGQGVWQARMARTLGAVTLCTLLGGEPGAVLDGLLDAEEITHPQVAMTAPSPTWIPNSGTASA